MYKDIEEYNLGKKGKVIINFDEMIADIISSKKLNSVVTELFIRDKRIKHFYCFYYTIRLKVPKNVRLNSAQFLSWKI